MSSAVEPTDLVPRRLSELSAHSAGIADVVDQKRMIAECMQQVMHEGQHYGIVPGTSRKDADGNELAKPCLFKPGAETLGFMFRLRPDFEVVSSVEQSDFIKYRVKCSLTHIGTGLSWGSALASCNSRETKYIRPAPKRCPKCNAEALIIGKPEYERDARFKGGWLCYQKKGGCGAKYVVDDETIMGQPAGIADPSDLDNTILKMGEKRAHVAAILCATAASDFFTQDLEDLEIKAAAYEPPQNPRREAEEAEAREAYRATVRESAGPKAGNAPGASVKPQASTGAPAGAHAAASTSTIAVVPASFPPGPKSYLPANKVIAKQGDPMSVAGQWQRLGVLRGEIGWVDWPKDDEHWDWDIGRWPMYRQNLGRYRTWEGKRCQSAKDLTFDQAGNFIRRMEEQHARNGIRHARMEDEAAENLGALGGVHEEPDLGLIDSTFEASDPAGRGPPGERAPTGAAPESPVNSHDGPGQGPKAPPPKDYVMCSPELRDEIVELVVTKQLTQQWAKDAVNKWFGLAYGSLLADMVGRLTQTQAMTYLELVMAVKTPEYTELLAASRAAGRIR